MVVVRNEINYLVPIHFGQAVRVGLRVERMGTKSITFVFQIESDADGVALARGKSVMVVYDNTSDRGVPIPPDWREKISQFEEKSRKP